MTVDALNRCRAASRAIVLIGARVGSLINSCLERTVVASIALYTGGLTGGCLVVALAAGGW